MPTLEYGRPARPASMSPVIPAALACVAGIVGNLWSIYLAASLRHAPSGISIRPMGLQLVLFLIAVGTFLVALPSAVAAIMLGRRRIGVWLTGLAGVVLSLTPLFLARWVMDWIIVRKGLIIGD